MKIWLKLLNDQMSPIEFTDKGYLYYKKFTLYDLKKGYWKYYFKGIWTLSFQFFETGEVEPVVSKRWWKYYWNESVLFTFIVFVSVFFKKGVQCLLIWQFLLTSVFIRKDSWEGRWVCLRKWAGYNDFVPKKECTGRMTLEELLISYWKFSLKILIVDFVIKPWVA